MRSRKSNSVVESHPVKIRPFRTRKVVIGLTVAMIAIVAAIWISKQNTNPAAGTLQNLRVAYEKIALRTTSFSDPMFTDGQPLDKQLNRYLSQDAKIDLKRIEMAQAILAKRSVGLEIIFIDNKHGNAITQQVSDDVRARQRTIASRLEQFPPTTLLLAEGLPYDRPITWQWLYDRNMRIAKHRGVACPSLETFRVAALQQRRAWWMSFLDPPKTRTIYGVDNPKICSLALATECVAQKNDHDGELGQFIQKLNYHWRDEIVVANVVIATEEAKADSAAVVLGEAHWPTFSAICYRYGISLTRVSFVRSSIQTADSAQ